MWAICVSTRFSLDFESYKNLIQNFNTKFHGLQIILVDKILLITLYIIRTRKKLTFFWFKHRRAGSFFIPKISIVMQHYLKYFKLNGKLFK